MQKGCFETPRFDTKGVVERINALAELFRKSNLLVIFIQHDGTQANEFVPGTQQWELLDELEVKQNDILIGKYANDIFYRSTVDKTLKELKVEELYITGCATEFCVESTIQSAYTKDYNITVVADGHTTADKPHLKAEKIIEHYNWVWQNMLHTRGKLRVMDFKEIKRTLQL